MEEKIVMCKTQEYVSFSFVSSVVTCRNLGKSISQYSLQQQQKRIPSAGLRTGFRNDKLDVKV